MEADISDLPLAPRRGPEGSSRTSMLVATAALLTFAATGCSDQGSPRNRVAQLHTSAADSQPPTQPSAAAAALSIANMGSLEPKGGYDRALACLAASVVVTDRLRNLPIAGQREMAALRQSTDYFRKEVARLSSDEGKSRAASQDDVRRAIEDGEGDPSAQTRTLVACLRSLEV